MDATKEFIRIFSGLTRAYGQTQSRSKNESGKLEGKSWIVPEQLTEDKWLNHLAGKEPSLGIIPINENNQCTWGAIDIDTYDGFDHKKLIKTNYHWWYVAQKVAALIYTYLYPNQCVQKRCK